MSVWKLQTVQKQVWGNPGVKYNQKAAFSGHFAGVIVLC